MDWGLPRRAPIGTESAFRSRDDRLKKSGALASIGRVDETTGRVRQVANANHPKGEKSVMKELTTQLTEALGSTGDNPLVHALVGLAILIVGLFVV